MRVVLQDPCKDKKLLTSKSPLVHQKRVHFHISEKWAWETKKQNFVFKDLRTLRFPNMQETIKEFSESFNDWSKVARKSRILWLAGNNSFYRCTYFKTIITFCVCLGRSSTNSTKILGYILIENYLTEINLSRAFLKNGALYLPSPLPNIPE